MNFHTHSNGFKSSHVSELWLSPNQDIPDPLNLKELPLDVIHGDGGVCHGHHVVLWKRDSERLSLSERWTKDHTLEKKYNIPNNAFRL